MNGPTRKRARREGGRTGGGPLSALKKAQLASYRFSHAQPWATYGAARIQRGSEMSLTNFGTSWRRANEAQRANRATTGFTGRGKYNFGSFLRRGVGAIARNPVVRGYAQKGLEGALDLAGRGLYTGRGAYASNNLISGDDIVQTGAVPMMTNSVDETGSFMITHTEYLGEVYAPSTGVTFNIQSFPLNPALSNVFPFLSQLASNYDEYEFVQLVFEYEPTVSEIGSSTSGQVGTVIMATNYNSSAPVFIDKEEMVSYAHSASTKTTVSMKHGVECDPSKTAHSAQLYTRAGPLAPNEDLKTYDHGTFQLALANTPSAYANQSIGELRVFYKVMLRKPKLFVSRGLSIQMDQFSTSFANGFQFGKPWGDAGNTVYLTGLRNSIGGIINVVSNQQLKYTFPASFNGSVRLFYLLTTSGSLGAAWNYTPPGLSYTGNVFALRDIYGGTTAEPTNVVAVPQALASTTTTTPQQFMIEVHLSIKQSTGGVDNTVSFTQTVGGTAKTQAMLVVSQYQSGGILPLTGRTAWIDGTGQVVLPS